MKTFDSVITSPPSPARNSHKFLAAACSLLLGGVAASHAASGAWTGLTDTTWAGNGNWDVSPVPGTNDIATFNGAGNGNTTIDLGSGVTISNVVFDTPSAAPYTIGLGAVGSQTLGFRNSGGISINSTVVNGQSFNAALSLPTNASASVSFTNNSSALLTLAGGVAGNVVSGNGVMTVGGSGNTLITGAVTKPGAGSMALLKTGAGQLTISTNGVWSGSGAIGYVPPTSAGFPLVAREGTLVFNGGSNFVNGEMVIGGVVANGGTGQNAQIVVDGSRLNIGSWLSVGRGNGIGTVSSDFVASNNAIITTVNVSAGFNGANGNLPKGSITLNNNSSLTANGSLYIGESSGSDMTMTLNDSAAVTNLNSAGIRVSSSGKGTLIINGGTVISEGDMVLNYTTSGGTNGSRVVLNGGNLYVSGSTPTSTAERWLIVKRTGDANTDLVVSNGTVYLNNQSDLRFSTQDANATGSNTVTIYNGAITGYSDRATTVGGVAEIDMQRNGGPATINTFNLNGGVVTIRDVISTVSSGTRIFNFNGGTLKPNASTTTFFNLGGGSAFANVRNGGAIIDSDGKDITIAQPLQHSDISGDNAIDGGLTKNGVGTLTLSGGTSYAGPTVVTGGALSFSPGAVSYFPTSLTVNNAALSLSLPSGFSSLTPTSLTLQNSSTLNFDYGSVTANPSAAAIDISGSLSAPGTITVNISGFGLKTGTFRLIHYSGTPLANLANFTLGPLPPGVVATLVNNTANTSIDLNITSAGQNLTWVGTNALTGLIDNTWDIAITTNWLENGGSTPLRYQEYTTTSTVGDPVRFDDSVFNDFINPQPTNINLTTALSPFSITVDSTLPYSFSGPGSLIGVGSVIKSNFGSLTLSTSNNYSGGTLIYAGSVIITNDNALGASAGKLTLGGGGLQVDGSSTNATRAVSVTAASTLGVATGANYQLGGVISGAGNLTKTDLGTLIVAGSNGITGSLIVDQGTVRSTGNETIPGVVRVANTASLNGVLTIPSGTFRASNNGGQFASSLIAGGVGSSAGDVVLSGGTLNVLQQLGLGAGAGGYGALNMSGGTLASGSYIVVGFNNDRAVFNQSGGTVTISSNLMTIAAGGTASIGVVNISGGTFTSSFGASSGIMVGERGIGTLNVSGAAVINVPTNGGLTIGPVGAQTGWDGTLNLNGGTITANRVVKGLGSGVARANFSGGTIKASTGNGSFMSGIDSATVYANGLTIDDGGFAITVAQPLSAPTDYGVNIIAVTDGGSGYIDSPIVTISGGSGSNATATATVSGGVVTAITVTCRGTGYGSGDVLSVSFDGGGASVTSATAGAPVLTANVSGGLTKKGAGTLNLTGASTYTNVTAVSAGTLLVSPAYQSVSPVTVASNASFGVVVNSGGAATIGNLSLGSLPVDKAGIAFGLTTGTNPVAPVLQTGTVTLNGTNTIRLTGTVTAGIIPLVKYSGAIAGSGSFATNIIVPQGQTAILSNDISGSTLYAIVSGLPGIVWTGTNSVAALTNVWNLNSATNWLASGVPTSYQEATPPGDPVMFNDVGSGVVLVSNTVSPASVTISNNSINYTFSGTGKISGPTPLTKAGTGTATLNLSGSDYTGNTIVNNGTLRLGSATTIPDGATAGAVSVDANGTFDLNGFSETINGLSGLGTINNSGATTATLTNGNGNGYVTWNGTTTNTGAGGVTLVKTGSGTMTLGGTNFLSGINQINGGSNQLTSAAQVTVLGTGEFWIGASSTASLTNNGGTLIVPSWLVIGRTVATANGTLVVNSGTVQKTGANNIVVGSVGATGTLIVNGGQVLNNGMLWLGENGTGNGSLYLNGGLIQATQVRPNNSVASSVANFNGGTLQASGANPTNFIATTVTCNVQSGGAVIDDGGFGIAIPASLSEDGSSPGGGLVKKGSGTVYLNGANSYSGVTIVTNGVLAGIGSINGPVAIGPAGKMGAGDAETLGTLTLNSKPLSIQGGAFMRVSKTGGTPANDQVAGLSSVSFGGTLVISNATSDATPLATGDTFQLFNTGGPGNFTSIVGSPGPGLAYAFNPANGVLSVVSGVATNPTNIVVGVSGSTLSLSWPADHLGWTLQTNSESLADPASWYPLAGSAAVTNVNLTIDPSKTNVFFRLVYP